MNNITLSLLLLLPCVAIHYFFSTVCATFLLPAWGLYPLYLLLTLGSLLVMKFIYQNTPQAVGSAFMVLSLLQMLLVAVAVLFLRIAAAPCLVAESFGLLGLFLCAIILEIFFAIRLLSK